MTFLKHFLLWVGLTLFFSLANHSYDPSEMLIQAINAGLFVIGYYFSYRFLVLPLLYNGKGIRFGLYYILTILILSAVSMVTIYQVYVFQQKKFFVENYWSDPVFFTSNFMLVLLSTSTLLGFRVIRDKLDTQRRLDAVEREKVSTELNFLKAQINPHFLFNSLNNILFQIDRSNMTARETLLKFSEMLRYQLYECNADVVQIEKEVQYLRNYVEIQSMRKTDRYQCRLDVSENVRDFQLAPLVLIPFVENAFKHISHHASGYNSIVITLDYSDGQLLFTVKNDKDDSKVVTLSERGGIGLTNVKRSLDLVYPGRHELEIRNTNEEYTVILKIKVA